MKNYLKLIRIEQWVKNLFVFIPIFFAGKLFDFHILVLSIYAFLIFSFTASAIYIFNDYMDIEKDKAHPDKKNRPLANNSISKKQAIFLFVLMLTISVSLTLIVGNWKAGLIVFAYFLMNICYSFGLKNIAIIDILIIAFGFLMRVLFGGYMTDIPVTDWTLLLVFDLALILALGKRRGELLNKGLEGKTRKTLDGYNKLFLDSAIVMSSTVAIVSYIMFVLSEEVQKKTHHFVLFTFLFVFASILKYLQLTFVYEKTESPTRLIFENRFLQIMIGSGITTYAFLIYFKSI